ncbi:MAG: hypothetical protein U0V75_09770 [Ferruginibacter sp.]
MKKQFYPKLFLFVLFYLFASLPFSIAAQNCSGVTATYVITESRCASTGIVQINASGGSGNYLYRVVGPVTTNFSTSNNITGLPAGRYLAVVKDLTGNCIYQQDSVTVPGNYLAASFLMRKTDVTCINGSDGTITAYNLLNGRAPFMYTIVTPSASNIGMQNSTGAFTGLLYGNYTIRLTDSCGGIQTRSMTIDNYDWWIDSGRVTRNCDSALAYIKLKDSRGVTTPNTVFNLFTYAVVRAPGDTVWSNSGTFSFYIGNKRSVTLLAKDKCGNIKKLVWTDNNKPAVNATVSISNLACSTFTATVTGMVNLTRPQICIYNAAGILMYCDSTGQFRRLAYGSYCIRITDACYDTTITRCFTVNRPVPSVAANVTITNKSCNDFTASVTATTNLNNPTFCIYDKNNVLMYCNTTGIFNNLPYGRYCIRITNDPACYDTTITRCFTVLQPVPTANNNVNITNMACSTFTVTLQDTANWNNPKFCLYDINHVIIVCNSTGVFTNLPYGTYCIEMRNDPACYDTTMWRCFTVNRPLPSVNANVKISSKTCTAFTAEIQGQQNLNNAQYCLYNSSNVLVVCNSTGKFTNLPYGSYCIRIANNPACYDTVISRCFTASPVPVQVSLSAAKSCSAYGTTDITVTVSSGIPSYAITILDDAGNVKATTVTSSSTYKVNGLPDLPPPAQYTIIVTDQCGNTDTSYITPNASVLNKKVQLTKKCPSGINPNGGADMEVTASTNMGTATPKIIFKNGIAVVITYNYNSGTLFRFNELPPATYIIEYRTTGCTAKLFDTVTVVSYVYPDLSQSRAYNCDSNTISIGAVATGGMTPYLYEIFQSIPATPSIITPPQPNPVFTFNNSTSYSLIRLRVVDGCGNASINDVSMQPLAPVLITPSKPLTCYYDSLTLSVDTIANATYQWWHKTGPNDSVLVSSTYWYFIHAIQPADTGWYVCHVSVNNYCLTRTAYYHLQNMCGVTLPVQLFLKAGIAANGNLLEWDANNEAGVKEYIIERSSNGLRQFIAIGKLPYNGGISGHYNYTDLYPADGNNYYRLRIIGNNGAVLFSNTVMVAGKNNMITVFPNPVSTQLTLDLSREKATGTYKVTVLSAAGNTVYNTILNTAQHKIFTIGRTASMVSGVYVVCIINTATGEQVFEKMLFR